ncbi:MAG: DegT/DnrJ/EryC1/StrS family aminotransferase [Bacteroidales bacterium]|nr:DegT/DnrJ/EryC1/StrS family aminotransferase [Bacteroidales bacterium]
MTERKMIYLCLAHMSDEGWEQKYVKEAFDTNWVVPLGPNVNGFEEDLKAFVNSGKEGLSKEVVALSAGTAAVHLGLLACGVGQGDEVCVQSFTFCASSHPITYLGATPVFIDSEPETWNMDPDLLEKAILDRKEKTGKYPKAIVPVALYGMPYNCDRIMAIADKYGIPVVEDAAEGFGSRYKGQVLGTFGRYGVLSFNGNKMITTSGGGALVCDNAERKNKILWYATQAREAYPYYQHEAIGYNYRMSNICAGIGRGQMKIVNDHIAHHKHVQKMYEELLRDVEGVTVHTAPSPDYDSNYWLCTICLDPDLRIQGQENAYKEVITSAVGGAAGVIHAVDSATTDCQPNDNVEALRLFMLDKKVEARPVWKPMHKQPVYRNAPAYVNGVSESIFKVGMCLPAGPYVSDDDVCYIVDCIKAAIIA